MSGHHDIDSAVPAVMRYIDATIERDTKVWAQWPGGWPGQISTALIDAVFSARAVYETAHGRGIKPLVERWRESHADLVDDLEGLRDAIAAEGAGVWAVGFGNTQRSPRRPADASGGPTKAAAVLEAADALVRDPLLIRHAADITDANVDDTKRALRGVKGIGYATINYFLMLLGRPGVKPDRMVHRFLERATGRDWTNRAADQLITRAAAELLVESHELDHAIWSYESRHAAQRDVA